MLPWKNRRKGLLILVSDSPKLHCFTLQYTFCLRNISNCQWHCILLSTQAFVSDALNSFLCLRYERFVVALEEASRDMLPALKNKALKVCFLFILWLCVCVCFLGSHFRLDLIFTLSSYKVTWHFYSIRFANIINLINILSWLLEDIYQHMCAGHICATESEVRARTQATFCTCE